MEKFEEDCNGLQLRFFHRTVLQGSFFLSVTFDIMFWRTNQLFDMKQ